MKPSFYSYVRKTDRYLHYSSNLMPFSNKSPDCTTVTLGATKSESYQKKQPKPLTSGEI